MAFEWATIALLGTLGSVPLFLLGPILYLAGPRKRQNVVYALCVLLQGTAALCGSGLMYLTTEPATAYAFQFLTNWLVIPTLALVLIFAGTLDTPLSKPFRSWWGAGPLILGTVAFSAYALVEPTFLVRGVAPASYAPWDGIGTPVTAVVFLTAPLVIWYVFLVGVLAARRTLPGSVMRAHALALSRAFGLRAASLTIALPMLVFATNDATVVLALCVFQGGIILQAAVLTHGIVKTQLFDVDLKIKWTLRRGTVAGAFVGVFFVVSEGAQTLFSARLGPVAGLVAAGALVFAIAPLQRFADGLADRALPRVQDTPEYRTVRKREVYRAAVESALHEGDISQKERGMLATFASELGLTPKEMHEIERDARTALAGAG